MELNPTKLGCKLVAKVTKKVKSELVKEFAQTKTHNYFFIEEHILNDYSDDYRKIRLWLYIAE